MESKENRKLDEKSKEKSNDKKLIVSKNGKKIILAASTVAVVGAAGFTIANAKKIQATFDPSAYSDDENKDDSGVSYDSTVFGANQDDQNQGLELDKKSQESYDIQENNQNPDQNQNITEQQQSNNQSMLIADGSSSESNEDSQNDSNTTSQDATTITAQPESNQSQSSDKNPVVTVPSTGGNGIDSENTPETETKPGTETTPGSGTTSGGNGGEGTNPGGNGGGTTEPDKKPGDTTDSDKKPDDTTDSDKKPDDTTDPDKKPGGTTEPTNPPKDPDDGGNTGGGGTVIDVDSPENGSDEDGTGSGSGTEEHTPVEKYTSLDVTIEKPLHFYEGQVVKMSDLEGYISATIGHTVDDVSKPLSGLSYLSFCGKDLDNPNKNVAYNSVVADSNCYFTLLLKKDAVANEFVYRISYSLSKYMVTVAPVGDVKFDSELTDAAAFNLSTDYNKVLQSLKESRDADFFLKPDKESDNQLKSIFAGWYLGNDSTKASTSVYSLGDVSGLKDFKTEGLIKLPDDYAVTLEETSASNTNTVYEQTLVAYSGTDAAMKVPNGVTRIEINDAKQSVNKAVASIELPNSVGKGKISFELLAKAFPMNQKYEVTNSAFYTTDETGLLFDSNGSTLVNVPIAHTKNGTCEVDLSKKKGTFSIGEDAFAGNKKDVTITIPENLNIDKGWDHFTEGTTVTVDVTSEKAYWRYYCAIQQQNQNNVTFKFKVDGQLVDSQYHYKDGALLNNQNEVVYVSPFTDSNYTLPSEATGIQADAFCDTSNIYSLTIPSNIKSIEDCALSGMSSLRYVVVKNPSAIGEIHLFADKDTPNSLLHFELFNGENEISKWADALSNVFGEKAELHISSSASAPVINGDGSIYKQVDGGWELESIQTGTITYEVPTSIIDEYGDAVPVTRIDSTAFTSCEDLIYVSLPDSITEISENTFTKCDTLEVLYVSKDQVAECKKQTGNLKNIKLVASSEDVIVDSENSDVFYSKDSSKLLAVLSNYSKDELKLLEQTKGIGENAVANCKNIKKVIVQSGELGDVGKEAFANCTKLQSLPIDKQGKEITTYTKLGDSAFENCKSITSITLTGSPTIGKGVFQKCIGITGVKLGDNGTDTFATTGFDTFAECTAIGQVAFNAKISEIGEGTFRDCTAISNMMFSDAFSASVKVIGDKAFMNCSSYVSSGKFSYLTSLTTIGDYAFYKCSGIRQVILSNQMQKIGDYAFAQETTGQLETFSIGSNSHLTEIGEGAFQNNANLKNVVLQDTQTKDGISIGNQAFLGCENLAYFHWGNNLRMIGARAFAGCSSLTDVELGTQSNLALLGEEAFAGCSAIVTANFANAPQLKEIPARIFGSYTNESTQNLSEESVETMSDEATVAVKYCDSLNRVMLGESITKIGGGAFEGATNLKTLEMYSPTKVEITGDIFYKSAENSVVDGLAILIPFSEKDSLRDKYISDASWQSALSFSDDSGTTEYAENDITPAPSEFDEYYDGGFYKDNGDDTYTLLRVTTAKKNGFSMLNNTTSISDEAFKGCSGITSVLVSGNVTKIGKNIFEGCTALEAVCFQSKTNLSIDTSLFGNTTLNSNFRLYACSGTNTIYENIPALKGLEVISTGVNWVIDTTTGALETTYASNSDVSVNGYIYQLMYLPRSYTGSFSVNNVVSYVYKEALRGCQLKGLYFTGAKLKSIGEYAFADCPNLEAVDLHSFYDLSKLDVIGEGAFQNCTALYTWYASVNDMKGGQIQIDRVSSMGDGVFKGCTSILTAKWSSKNLSEIPNSTFEDCTRLTYMTFGVSLTENNKPITKFGDRCFAGCVGFTTQAGSLASFAGLETIGKECFEGCSNMSLLILPTSLTTVEENAFAECDALNVIAMSTQEPLSLANAGISTDTWGTLGAYVPTGRKQAYLDVWNAEGISAPGSIVDPSEKYRSISGNIYGCEDPTWTYYGYDKGNGYHSGLIFAGTTADNSASGTISIYRSTGYRTTEIGAGALEGNQDLVAFNGYVTGYTYSFIEKIGDAAFRNCSNLTTAEFSATYGTPLEIGNSAFEGCSSLGTFQLRKYTTSIGNAAFAGTKEGFILDATVLVDSSQCVLAEKIFGDTIPSGTQIVGKDQDAIKALIQNWGVQLKTEYELTDEQLLALFKDSTVDMLSTTVEEVPEAQSKDATDLTLEGTETSTGTEAATGTDTGTEATTGAVLGSGTQTEGAVGTPSESRNPTETTNGQSEASSEATKDTEPEQNPSTESAGEETATQTSDTATDNGTTESENAETNISRAVPGSSEQSEQNETKGLE